MQFRWQYGSLLRSGLQHKRWAVDSDWAGYYGIEEEYHQALNAVYDEKKAVPGYDRNDFYTKEEVIKAISDLKE